MAPWLPALISGLFSFGSSALGAASQDEPQKRQSFRGTGTDSDPVELLKRAVQGTTSMGQALQKRARTPVKLRSTFQSLPGFAKDPALADPSLLEGRSLDLGNPFGGPPTEQSIDEAMARFQSRLKNRREPL